MEMGFSDELILSTLKINPTADVQTLVALLLENGR